jgi:hypothetical protein
MRNILVGIAFVVSAAAVLVAVAHPEPTLPQDSLLGVALPSGSALFETSLQDRILSTDTSLSLVANSLQGSEALSGYNCFTIDEGRSDAEFVCGTVAGTSVTGLERGLSLLTGTTSITALKFQHRKGADVKITDYPLIQRMRNQLSGTDTINTLIAYTSGVACNALTASTSICSKDYFDQLAIQGAPTSTESTAGLVRLATALQQASSTDLGANIPLALQAKYATSSPTGTAASLYALILNNLGKIEQTAIDFTKAFTLTGGLSSTGTTTVSASNLTSNPFVINSLAYKFPSVRGAASTVLTEDGSGNLTFAVPQTQQYTFATTTATTVTNGYATTTALSIPAGFVTASSSILVTGYFTCAVGVTSSGDTCDLYLRDTTGTGATLVSHILFATVDNGNTTFTGTFSARVFLNNSVSSQKSQLLCSYIGYSAAFASGKTTFCGDTASASQNWANAFALAIVIHSSANATAGVSSVFMQVSR